MSVVARKREIEILKKVTSSNKPEFVVVYGRRRVGKTFLVKEFYNDSFSFYSTGVFSKSKKDQLSSFTASLKSYGDNKRKGVSDWFGAFDRLQELLDTKTIYRCPKSKKRVVFLDEVPWMDTPKSNFRVALERFWNTYGSRQNDLVLIVCGSATSWIIKHLINDRGGFYGRLTNKLYLAPFTLKECEDFANMSSLKLSRHQIADYYMVLGGVPHYFSLLDSSLSVAQNIDALIFDSHGPLHDEFSMLFASLFNKYDLHVELVNRLAKNVEGLTRDELIDNKLIKDGGALSRALEELEQCGFIRSFSNYKSNKYKVIYQIVDPFVLFVITYIQDKKVNSWMNYLNSSGYQNWVGHAFELLCLNHVKTIKYSLDIYGIETNEYAYRSKNTQIGLLIDRSDKIINLCECKYSNDEYSISLDDQKNVQNKIKCFNEATKNRKDIIVTFITINGVKNNMYRDVAQKVLDIDSLFAL